MIYPYTYTTYNIGCVTPAQLAQHDTWRSLWEQHVAWTRMTIISAVFGLPDLQVTSTRLLSNPTDMGNAMKPFYGDAIASGFTALICKHLLIAMDLVSAAKKGDTATAAAAEKAWYANADDIAVYLSGINPNWPQNVVRDMLYTHLSLTKAEAVAMLTGDYQKSVDLYDEIERQALGMADAISSGISKQFGL